MRRLTVTSAEELPLRGKPGRTPAMTRYSTLSTDAIRTARTKLIAGLANVRITPETRIRMEGWVAEAEAELVARAARETEAATIRERWGVDVETYRRTIKPYEHKLRAANGWIG